MSGIDWDKLTMLQGGAVTPAAWNELLRLLKRCYVSQVIGGERRDVGPHTAIDVSQGRGSLGRNAFHVAWRGGKIYVWPGVVTWRLVAYLVDIDNSQDPPEIEVEQGGSYEWFDLVPEVESEALVVPLEVGDDENKGERLWLRVKSDAARIPQEADFVWDEDRPPDVQDADAESENTTHFEIAAVAADGRITKVRRGDIYLPICVVQGSGTEEVE